MPHYYRRLKGVRCAFRKVASIIMVRRSVVPPDQALHYPDENRPPRSTASSHYTASCVATGRRRVRPSKLVALDEYYLPQHLTIIHLGLSVALGKVRPLHLIVVSR